MILHCATTNPGKLREFAAAAGHFGFPDITVETLPQILEIEPCEEDGATFEENAVRKAVHYSSFSSQLVFADDSGLEVDALAGAPGVRSARYSPEGTDEANNRRLLEQLEGIEDRTARFVCVVALARQGVLVATFHGVVEGRISDAPRGPNGFGYDPLFFYEPFQCTFGEAPSEQKMGVSHRGQALQKLFTFCRASLPGAVSTLTSR